VFVFIAVQSVPTYSIIYLTTLFVLPKPQT
jgi:hypothetical protein